MPPAAPPPSPALAAQARRFYHELVMRELKKLDKVAYVRFASVYRSFEDIDEFKTLVDEVRR